MNKVKRKIRTNKDLIFIEDITASTRVGCTEEERAFPQIVHLDITLFLSLSKAGASDNLRETIDYAMVVQRVRNLLEKKSFNLLERIATVVANDLLRLTPVKSVQIRAAKTVLVGVGRTGVSICREK